MAREMVTHGSQTKQAEIFVDQDITIGEVLNFNKNAMFFTRRESHGDLIFFVIRDFAVDHYSSSPDALNMKSP